MVVSATALRHLADADWLKADGTRAVFALLDGDEQRIRAVGGAVRDTLLGRMHDAADIDFATEFLPEEVMARAKQAGIAAYPTGVEHGTVTLRLGDFSAEITTLRQDIETDGRHAVVVFGTDWVRDAERRDFTLNALYLGADGELFDPIGGAEDCLAGRVRFIGDPERRIAEDRLRVYRFFRFSASHGNQSFDRDGLLAVRQAAGDLGGLSAERVGEEMRRMLGLPRIGLTLRTMAEAGILAVGAESLEHLVGYERHAPKPNGAARLALIVANTDANALKERWRLANDELGTAETILAAARLLMAFKLNEAAYRYPAAIADGLEVAAVLAGWTDAGRSALSEQLRGVAVPRFPASGDDLIALGYVPGKALGLMLEALEQQWIESGFTLDRQALLDIAKRNRRG